MELMNEFEVRLPIDAAWVALTDLRRLTPCVPGARLHEGDDHQLHGVLEIKVGPIDAQYEGRSAFVDLDEANHQIVLSITGHETQGQGDATASITLDLEPRGATTQVAVLADLSVSGKVAQFGREVLAEVSAELMQQFVDNLQAAVSDGRAPTDKPAEATTRGSSGDAVAVSGGSIRATEAAARGASEPGVRAPDTVSDSAGDGRARDSAGTSSMVTRVAAVIGAVIAVAAFGYLLKRRGQRRDR